MNNANTCLWLPESSRGFKSPMKSISAWKRCFSSLQVGEQFHTYVNNVSLTRRYWVCTCSLKLCLGILQQIEGKLFCLASDHIELVKAVLLLADTRRSCKDIMDCVQNLPSPTEGPSSKLEFRILQKYINHRLAGEFRTQRTRQSGDFVPITYLTKPNKPHVEQTKTPKENTPNPPPVRKFWAGEAVSPQTSSQTPPRTYLKLMKYNYSFLHLHLKSVW